MIDLDDLRARPDAYEKAANQKKIAVSIPKFLALDAARRESQKRLDDMRAEKNAVSKRMPSLKGTEKETALTDMKKLSEEIKTKEEDLAKTEEVWREMYLQIPTIPHPRVPVGNDDKGNKEVKKWGDPAAALTVKNPKDHVTLGEALGILDIPRGVKLAGARSYFLKGDGARLQMAVMRFAVDALVKKGWTLFNPPLMANWDCLMGTGFFPGAEEQTYAVGPQAKRGEKIEPDDLYLIGTSEVSVCSYHKDEVLPLSALPTRYCGYSSCFRRESGTYGKDTKGLYRVHQFEKVEQVVLCEASEEKALKMFEEIRTNAEEVLQALKLPYRVLDICTGDMGRGKVYMQDIETWMPSRKAYGETHSCSYLGDFQARRLNIKYEDKDGKKKFVHTLNNTCIASPRILIPLFEIYQNEDGSITIPEVLRAYMGGQERIG
ncbi:MAG: serine--tRNA ligase [Candidatus Peribacteraceae bacterium]|nr:serine--tRNA ligase [Candidatus Peribacteraceae bacterium]